MNRIDYKFDEINKKNEKALIGYLTCGDPNLSFTKKAVLEMINNGADLIELGVPFSDPSAEGDTIYNATMRALENNINIDDIFNMVIKLRIDTDAPLLLMLYYNTLFAYGSDKFLNKCSEVGIDGLIIPDLPFEESRELNKECDDKDIYLINLITLSSKDRIEKLATSSKGFIYAVTSKGVTGIRKSFDNISELKNLSKEIKKFTNTPLAFGFGISTGKDGEILKDICDGIIIGSAFVKIIEENPSNSLDKIKELTIELKNSIC